MWTEFSRCDHFCTTRGRKLPLQSRTRDCYPERFDGKTCEDLSSNAHKNGLPKQKETKECEEVPICPENAEVGRWTDWSQCPKCYNEGEKFPMQNRNRPCTEARKSNDTELDKNILDCNAYHLKEERPCNIQLCPVDASWSDYSSWGECSSNCVEDSQFPPTQYRARMCYPPRYNGKACDTLRGSFTDKRTCSGLPDCPKNAVLGNWTPWSETCDECYDETSGAPRPQQERRRTCEETQLTEQQQNLNMKVTTCAEVGDVVQTKTCRIRSCPIPASWGQWTQSWEKCDGACKLTGKPHPQQRRTRICNEAKYGGETCQQLVEKEALAGNTEYVEQRDCPGLLDCPINANVGEWEAWTSACGLCYKGGSAPPQQTKKRACTSAQLSGDPMLDAGILTCDMMVLEQIKPCQIPMCKGMPFVYLVFK